MKKVICTKCKKFVDYSIEYKQEKTTIKEKEITYFKAEAHCKECGAIVWVEEIEEQNILAPIDQYCVYQNLITREQIINLLEKYDIGKRPLSILLGWSEVTITRFLDGQIPSKVYSDKLLSLFNLNEFLSLLNANKHLITSIAYKKTYQKILKDSLNSFIGLFGAVDDGYDVTGKYVNVKYDSNFNRGKGGVQCHKLLCNC